MFQVFYLEDQNYPYHDFILDGYNMKIYEHLTYSYLKSHKHLN